MVLLTALACGVEPKAERPNVAVTDCTKDEDGAGIATPGRNHHAAVDGAAAAAFVLLVARRGDLESLRRFLSSLSSLLLSGLSLSALRVLRGRALGAEACGCIGGLSFKLRRMSAN